MKVLKIFDMNQKTLTPLIHIAIILIGIDIITTIVGLKLGLEENNFISIVFINMFGNFYGLMASITSKSVIVIFPMIAYQYVQKDLQTMFLKNTYWILYMVLIMITIITTFITDINNIMEIIYKLQYQAYIHSYSISNMSIGVGSNG
jgi:hypothetical protein